MIRLTIPSIDNDDLKAVQEVLETGYLVQGKHVASFEKEVAEYVGAKYAIATSNGTASLHLALLALGIEPGDLVVVTAYSFIATANVIELCGAKPIFVDIDPDTFNIDPNRLEETLIRLMSNDATAQRVKAILPVHTFGQIADMAAILELANRHNLPVIEDAACALGATLSGKQAGTWGKLGCFSFHPRKAITTGEGGMITTDDADLARQLRALRNHGQDPESKGLEFILPGFNYRMTDFQAALGLTQLAKLDRIIDARRQGASIYNSALTSTSLQAPIILANAKSVYQSYVTLLPENSKIQRDELIQILKKEGIETSIGTWHMPMTKFFRQKYAYNLGDFLVADQVFERSLTLPLYERITPTLQKTVTNTIIKYFG